MTTLPGLIRCPRGKENLLRTSGLEQSMPGPEGERTGKLALQSEANHLLRLTLHTCARCGYKEREGRVLWGNCGL